MGKMMRNGGTFLSKPNIVVMVEKGWAEKLDG
jgi:hypothetical protein